MRSLSDLRANRAPDFVNARVLAANTNEVSVIPLLVSGATVTNVGDGNWDNTAFPTAAFTAAGGNGVTAAGIVLMEAHSVTFFGNVPNYQVGDYLYTKSDRALRQARIRITALDAGVPNAAVVVDGGLFPAPVENGSLGVPILMPGENAIGDRPEQAIILFRVKEVRITNPGSGYASTPSITISGGVGAGATASASTAVEPRYVVIDTTAEVYCKFGTSGGVAAATPADTADGSASFLIKPDKPLLVEIGGTDFTHVAFLHATNTPTITLSYYRG